MALVPDCQHVYKRLNTALCPYCGLPTNEVDWVHQNKLKEQWHKDNPNAQYEGWMSI
jgi:predicted amidophosphoribosyltransferase